jgi:hypothetical protein
VNDITLINEWYEVCRLFSSSWKMIMAIESFDRRVTWLVCSGCWRWERCPNLMRMRDDDSIIRWCHSPMILLQVKLLFGWDENEERRQRDDYTKIERFLLLGLWSRKSVTARVNSIKYFQGMKRWSEEEETDILFPRMFSRSKQLMRVCVHKWMSESRKKSRLDIKLGLNSRETSCLVLGSKTL